MTDIPTVASGTFSIAIGKQAFALADFSVALGDFAVADQPNQVTITNQLSCRDFEIDFKKRDEIWAGLNRNLVEHKNRKSAQDYQRITDWLDNFFA